MVPSLPLLSCDSSVSVKENPDRKTKQKKLRQLELKKRASKVVLQIMNDGQGKCQSWTGQAFVQKSSIGKQCITILLNIVNF